MGSGLSSQFIMQRGLEIRFDLHHRVDQFKEKYRNELKSISPKLKKHVITKSALELVKMLQSKEVTSQELVLIFAQRAATFGVKNNYVFDEMFQDALVMARQCDQERRKHPQKKNWDGKPQTKSSSFPPFYGIPASYKENIRLKGKANHVGFVIPHPKNLAPEQNGLFAELTIRMGFIPFVRSNVPLSCKTCDTNNNMFGYAKNPWNEERSCGGSSGGEGGLVGGYCSPIGFGTDIGGSLRIPAEWNGLVSLKPAARYSRMGNCFYGKITGGTPIKSDLGPIARSTEDIIMFMKFMCDQSNYTDIPKSILDPYLTLKPFSTQIFTTHPKLRIGYLTNLQTITCSLTHSRAVQQSKSILTAQGHSLVPAKLDRFQQLYLGMIQMYSADGSLKVLEEISFGEKLTPEFKLLALSAKVPDWLKGVAGWLIKGKEPRVAKMMENSRQLKVGEMFERFYEMFTQIGNEIHQYFIQNNLDAIIMPSFAFPSPRYGHIGKLQYTFAYTCGWNVINYPAGVLPVTVVRQNEQVYEDNYNDSVTSTLKQDMKQSKGMPVGVQVVALPMKEEIVAYLMNQLEREVKFREKYPCKNALEYCQGEGDDQQEFRAHNTKRVFLCD